MDASEKSVELLVLTGASRDARVVPGITTNLLEELRHLTGLVEAVVRDVALEQAVHVTCDDAGGGVDDRKPVAQELVEDLVIAVRAERLLDLAPVVGVEVLLLVHGKTHEHEVAHEVRRGEVLTRRVHRLEDELRVVLALRERDSNDLKALNAVPDHVGIVNVAQPRPEEGEVVDDSVGPTHNLDVRILQVVDNGAERLLVPLREGKTIVVLPLLVLEDKVAAVDDLLVGDVRQFVRMLSGKLRHRSDKKAERGDALLAIDDEELVHTRGAELPAQHHDHGAREVSSRASPPNGDNVIPELPALFLVPRVGTLVDGNDHPLVCEGKQADN